MLIDAVTHRIGEPRLEQVERVVEEVAQDTPLKQVALHFHDTRGTALANVLAGLLLGAALTKRRLRLVIYAGGARVARKWLPHAA